MEIRGKTILITGGAIRIGAAIAKRLAQKGARLALHYHRSEAEALALQTELRAVTDVDVFRADFGRMEEVRALAVQVEKSFGGVDVLINSAAIFEGTPLFEITEENWDRHLTINSKAPFFLSQALAKGMLEKKQGKIINVIDYTAFRPSRGYLPYSLSKAALNAMTIALARELAPYVTVNAVALGPTLPPSGYSEEKREQVASGTLLKRWGNPREAAEAVCFLIEGTDYATGSVLHLDGGKRAY